MDVMAGFWPNVRQTNSTGRREERGAAMTLFRVCFYFLPVLRKLLVYCIAAYFAPDRSLVLACACSSYYYVPNFWC